MGTWFRIVAWTAGILGAIAGLLYAFFFDVWTVPGDDPLLAASIEPTLSAGDVVVVSRHPSVARGNLLRCADPQAPGRFVIARAIARYGDKFEVQGEAPSIDDRRTPSPRRCEPPNMVVHDPQTNEDISLACSVEEYGEVTFSALRSQDHPEPPTRAEVEAGRWFLVSDDRHVHLDSRDFGQIDVAGCQHIVFRLIGHDGFGDASKRFNVIW
jgi:signal peptidase I